MEKFKRVSKMTKFRCFVVACCVANLVDARDQNFLPTENSNLEVLKDLGVDLQNEGKRQEKRKNELFFLPWFKNEWKGLWKIALRPNDNTQFLKSLCVSWIQQPRRLAPLSGPRRNRLINYSKREFQFNGVENLDQLRSGPGHCPSPGHTIESVSTLTRWCKKYLLILSIKVHLCNCIGKKRHRRIKPAFFLSKNKIKLRSISFFSSTLNSNYCRQVFFPRTRKNLFNLLPCWIHSQSGIELLSYPERFYTTY